jgi:hypothetical protein
MLAREQQADFAGRSASGSALNDPRPSAAQVDFYVSSAFGRAFFDSCKDVVYPVMNQKAMKFVGG